ncbi:MAG: hypothetical protein ACRDN0_40890 [Trebonia sp.]
MTGALDAMGGNSNGAAAQISKGASRISLVAALKGRVRQVTVPVHVHVRVKAKPASPTPAPPPAPTTPPPAPTTPAAAPSASATAAASCYPLSDEGTCYEPGEYCRDSDHGVSGVAGDGEAITCEDNDGWRWEPA